MAELETALAGVRLLALDIDGTLTDGRVSYCGESEIQSFSARDGQGLVWLRETGVHLAWISGRGGAPARRRAAELGVVELHCGARDKLAVLRDVQARLGVEVAETLSMGDDLPDLAMAKTSKLFACPADAAPEVRSAADLVLRADGGAGAARELAELILRAKGLSPGESGAPLPRGS